MRNKRNYNNLFDSICMTILFLFCLAFYFLVIWFGVINNSKAGTDPAALLIISTIVFGSMPTITAFFIIKYCYEYWVLLDDSIICKKLFSKRRQIKLAEIKKVEKKMMPALILGVYKSEAYIIYSNDRKIMILIKEGKKYSELDYELTKFINY